MAFTRTKFGSVCRKMEQELLKVCLDFSGKEYDGPKVVVLRGLAIEAGSFAIFVRVFDRPFIEKSRNE